VHGQGFVRVVRDVRYLARFEYAPGCSGARESHDGSAKDLDTVVVCGIHVHRYWNEATFGQAEAF
jgi:hypothetical protein